LAGFSKGLLALADAHACELIGGDTTRGPLNIAITGVVGVLLEAKRRGMLSSVKAELHRLRIDARFFIARGLEASALAAAGE
jgi:predicted nucleic acid-binding protein